MSDMIPPALSAKEWADMCVEGECRNDELAHLTRGWDSADPEKRTVDDLPHHRIAAVALKDQPFGFTRADVEILRLASQGWDRDDDTGDRLLELSTRVEALLPPE